MKDRTDEMKILGNRRDRKWTRYMETGDINHYKEFVKYRNKVKKLSRKNRRNFEHNLATNAKVNPKAIWKYINARLNINKEITDIYIDYNNTDSTLIEDQFKIVNIFADYFDSVFTIDENIINYPPLDKLPITEPMEMFTISEEEVSRYIKKLDVNKSEGPDKINGRIIFELHDVIVKPLTILFNNSLKYKKVPDAWKLAHVAPIHKKGNRKLVANYRPVSLTSVTCKLMEKIICSYITNHITVNSYFSMAQHGFIKGRSITTQLLEIMDQWTLAFDNNNQIDCLYLDFKKAFDSVSHKLLVYKLKMYNISESIISWIESFVHNRKQAVQISGTKSKWTVVKSGVPQGSILGPLLFLLFINDIPSLVNSNVMLFADDTKIWRKIQDENDILILQQDLKIIEHWCKTWKLYLNTEKCKYMEITTGEFNDTIYKLSDKEMTKVKFEKDIGIIFDSKLEFDRHILEKANKANSTFGMIRRTFKHLDERTFIPLYKAISRCHFDFGTVIWNPYKEQYNDQIERVQRRATKCIPNLNKLSYIQTRFSLTRTPLTNYSIGCLLSRSPQN